ncbi:MAG: ABC transporter ATP-binding protein [Geminicoccaceae bacterium]|nr:ABC transporter ATP-binding protein [Geminicoccaceae bacterium]
MTERAGGPEDGTAGDLRVAGLQVEHLSHAYDGRVVVRDVSLGVRPGEVHCLMGPSGCGKTTTLRLIAGLAPVQAGTLRLDGRLLAAPGSSVPCEQRRIGLMFQDLALFPHLTVAANIGFGVKRLGREVQRARVRELLALVGLEAHASKYPHMLSGGEQQRVALARALAPRPRLMLLDEPFSALDSTLRAGVREDILSLLREAGVPTLLVTHDPEEAITSGDRVHVMQDGALVQSAAPDELYRHPATEFVADFFGPTLKFVGHVKGGLINTPLGIVAAPDRPDGDGVDVLFRTEAVNLQPDYAGEGRFGHVVGCRRMGPACSIALALDDGSTIALRKPIETPHKIGMRMGFTIDERFAFVFPRTGDEADQPGGL